MLDVEHQELRSLPRRRTEANRFVRKGRCAHRDRHGRRDLYEWAIKDYETDQVISTKRSCGQAYLRLSESQPFLPFCGRTEVRPT